MSELNANRLRVLFVDDEAAIVKIGKRLLERTGYTVEAVENSTDALELFKAFPDKYSLVITDLTMPHMTGIELAREIMAIRPDTPVILCTGYEKNQSIIQAMDAAGKVVQRRSRIADWEGDTVIGSGHQGVLVTLVERKTRFALGVAAAQASTSKQEPRRPARVEVQQDATGLTITQQMRVNGEVLPLDPMPELAKNLKHSVDLVVDRVVLKADMRKRLADSVELGLTSGEGRIVVSVIDGEDIFFSTDAVCPRCSLSLPRPSPQLFSFNSPQGACPHCSGLGAVEYYEPVLLAPNGGLSLRLGAILPWKGRAFDRFATDLKALLKA